MTSTTTIAAVNDIQIVDGYFVIPPKSWSEILPGLYQGGTHDEDVIRKGGVKPEITSEDFQFVVTAYPHAMPIGNNDGRADMFLELRVPFGDSHIAHAPMPSVIQAAKSAYSAWNNGLKTLIRCQAGMNRSGLITALVLVKHGMDVDEAISLIREKRHHLALYNASYTDWLRANAVQVIRKESK